MRQLTPVTKPFLPEMTKYHQYLQEIFDSQILTNNGPMLQKLKAELEAFLGVRNLLLVANGTLALQIAFKALALKGKVITTPFSFAATATTLTWEGLTPQFCDVDSETLNISPNQLVQQNLSNVSAVMPVHVFGNPCANQEIQKFCTKNNMKLIYDASHAFDVKIGGNSILSWGDASTLSFHATKIFHTVEGGAIIFKDDDTYEEACRLINFGFETSGIDVVRPGINAKMSEIHAAMGLAVLERFQEIRIRRKEIFNFYRESLGSSIQFQKISPDVDWNYSYCPILLRSEDDLLKIRTKLNEQNILPRRYFYPSMDQFTCYSTNSCAVSSDVAKRVLCLPTYHDLSMSQLRQILELIKGACL
jgi:dTDP-4-amino-4,6-dideoxygalactose transaminase